MENTSNVPLAFLEDCNSKSRVTKANDTSGSPMAVGSRNSTLASQAGLMRRQGASEDEIFAGLLAMNNLFPEPLGEEEVRNIARSIARYDVQPNLFTHDRFASYLAKRLVSTVMYCEGYGLLVYRDGWWQSDNEGLRVTHLIRQVVDEVHAQAMAFKDKMSDKDFNKLMKNAAKLENAGFQRESLKLMKSDPSLLVKFSDLNADKHRINLANGTLDLRTRTLHEFNPTDKLSHKLDVEYDAKADCPVFRQFLADVLPGELAPFMLRIIGYAMLGHGREQKFFILHGTGKNGKSTLLEVVTALFKELTATVQPESLNGAMAGAIRNDLARIAGKRLMITSETRSGTVLDAPLIKQITGLDTLTARFLHKEFFEFQATAVPFIITNYLPVVDGGDSAMKRRLCVIGFDTVVEKPDLQLSDKLLAEKSGILNLILDGLVDYTANGLAIPTSVLERTEAFVERSNLLKGFFDDTFEYGEADGKPLSASLVYSFYTTWCKNNGYKPMSMNMFKDAFERTTGLSQERNNQGRYWPNIRMRIIKV